METKKITSHVKPIAQAGLTAKGIVYCLLGLFAFMAAFNIAGRSSNNTDKQGVFSFIEEQTGGQIMLAIVALGLLCYSVWRGLQTFADTENKGDNPKGLAARTRYLFSGLVYTSLAAYAIRMLLAGTKSSGDSKQTMAQELLNKPFGPWLAGIAAGILFAVGIYQCWYSLSEKYSKHVNRAGNASSKKILLAAGKIGYLARGIVWLILGWLFARAAFNSNPSEAGDTSKAFRFLEETYGSYIMAAVAAGLICYGLFNFVRVRYERFD